MTRKQASRWLLAVLVLTFILYAPSLRNTFTLDDRVIAMAVRDSGEPNPMVAELQPLGRYFTTNYWNTASAADVLYRPLTVLSYALVYTCLGRHLEGESGEALPQHMLNVGLHMLTVWLVYLLARRLRAMRVAALVAALVFGVHAIHSEVVAGVVGRAELLAFVFGAAGTLCFSHGYSAAGGRRAARWAAAALLLLLGFCSKESALVWAPVMVVFEMARAWRADPTARVVNAVVKPAAWALVVSAMPVAMFFVLRARMIGNLPPGAAAAWSAAREQTFAGIRPATGFVQWGYAFVITLLPFKLAADYGPAVFTPVESLGDPRFLLAFSLLVTVLVAGLLVARRQPLLFAAVACFFSFSFLTSNVPMPIGTEFAERLSYGQNTKTMPKMFGVLVLTRWSKQELGGRCDALLTRGAETRIHWRRGSTEPRCETNRKNHSRPPPVNRSPPFGKRFVPLTTDRKVLDLANPLRTLHLLQSKNRECF